MTSLQHLTSIILLSNDWKLENFGKIQTFLGLKRQKIVRMHKTYLTSQFLSLSLARFFREGKYAISEVLCPCRVFFSNFPCLSVNIFVCKFVYIVRTDQNPFGSCQPFSILYIYHDDSMCSRLLGYLHVLSPMMCLRVSVWMTIKVLSR